MIDLIPKAVHAETNGFKPLFIFYIKQVTRHRAMPGKKNTVKRRTGKALAQIITYVT